MRVTNWMSANQLRRRKLYCYYQIAFTSLLWGLPEVNWHVAAVGTPDVRHFFEVFLCSGAHAQRWLNAGPQRAANSQSIVSTGNREESSTATLTRSHLCPRPSKGKVVCSYLLGCARRAPDAVRLAFLGRR